MYCCAEFSAQQGSLLVGIDSPRNAFQLHDVNAHAIAVLEQVKLLYELLVKCA